jgi:DNA-binding transcriptional LysR family regulator
VRNTKSITIDTFQDMNSMRFELRHVRCLLAVAEELHFGRAAARLHIAQPALSRTIRELEAEVGAKLLARTTRKVELTEAGRVFCAECGTALHHLENAALKARQAEAGIIGELRIAYMDFAINGRMPHFLEVFRQANPHIRLDIQYMSTNAQQIALVKQQIDIGFMIGEFAHASAFNYQFEEDRYVALIPMTHRLANRSSLSLADLAGEPFVLGNGQNWAAFRDRFFAVCSNKGFLPQIAQEASSSEGIFGLVAAGVGVSVYSSCVRNIQRRGLAIKPLDDVHQTLTTNVVWFENDDKPSIRQFGRFLRDVWGGAPKLGSSL